MKQCPKCGTAYTDETLRFCLTDGSVLSDHDEQATFVRPAGGLTAEQTAVFTRGDQMRVEIPQDIPRATYAPQAVQPAAAEGTPWLKIFLLVGLVVVLFVIAAGVAGALIYFNKDSRTAVTNTNKTEVNRASPTATPAASPSNSESDQLKEQIANLEKRLNEQKNANRSLPNVSVTPPDQPTATVTTARVNSPGDGFLALRSYPSSNLGDRVLQIPHGARININGCLARTRVGNKTGRWCRATYGSYSGWVFDAWLVY